MSFFNSSLRISPKDFPVADLDEALASSPGRKLAVLAGGCFWCVEAVYRELSGVLKVVNGYSGGTAETADYKAVCTGRTDHAEVVQIEYDPSQTSFGALLRIFFAVAHDPTQLDRQGNDIGTQYRSAIFYADEEQKRIAEAYIRQLDAAQVYSAPVVTKLDKLEDFFEAEAYHQNYAALHPNEGYIAGVALPKVDKLRRYFGEELKA
ncbi:MULTISPECIES: peptide-methionine (S)-S-oxide reductase MsrA [Hydrocarboniphaga]|uniref:Peptide methionine sulfoxide reductase MsrA n=1 Tax=Hydrocarboniphaga effusa AP103 TaxID=1172194 RepID=I8TEQ2_9GAMM|nr:MULTISPECIES: peptide-methionine (S)-S-oxide reductase MsrA [Hydrocarboniphaga]EIT72203.1 acetyl-CoA carboxylase [Hydrocarboniphaga effusa AP103]MDZ4079662.1 peptide-methionine (S)-S-oxide reductase MsrA [Hydrocarboniphaga sp.]